MANRQERTPRPVEGRSASSAPAREAAPSIPGWVYVTLPTGVARVEPREGARPELLAPTLEKLSSGRDQWAAPSFDGSHLALGTTRFGCGDWACLAVVRSDLTAGQEVRTPSGKVHPDGTAAIGPGGAFVVYAAKGPVHTRDLFLVRRAGDGWSNPENLTAAGRHAYNKQPALSPDGRRVAFDCGPDPYGQEGTATCVLDVERPVPTERWSPGQAPLEDAVAVHHPGWERDGSLLLEIKRKTDGERVYRLRPGATAPEPFGTWTNDNAPCALPDGRIATLWLNRPENRAGLHELKIMSEDGATGFGLIVDVDIVDTGTFCAARR